MDQSHRYRAIFTGVAAWLSICGEAQIADIEEMDVAVMSWDAKAANVMGDPAIRNRFVWTRFAVSRELEMMSARL